MGLTSTKCAPVEWHVDYIVRCIDVYLESA